MVELINEILSRHDARKHIIWPSELARAISPVWQEHRFLLMIKAFFDETADEKRERVYAIGGYWGEASEWDGFSYAWLDALDSQNIEVFHAVDFFARQGEFSGWDTQRAIAFVRELIQIIHRFNLYGFHSAIVLEDFRGTFPNVKRENSAHLLCMKTCIENVLYMTEALDETVQFIFEENTTSGFRPLILYDQIKKRGIPGHERMGGKGFVAQKDFPPLQAADLIAWEGRRHLDNEIQESGIPLRKTLQLLAAKGRLFGRLWDKDRLTNARDSGVISEKFFEL